MKGHFLSDKWADLGIINIDGLKPKYIWTLGYDWAEITLCDMPAGPPYR